MKTTLICLLLGLAGLVLAACTPNQRANRGGYYGPYGGGARTMSELESSNWQVRNTGRGTTIKYLD